MPSFAYSHVHIELVGTIRSAQSWSVGLDFLPGNVYSQSDLKTWVDLLDTPVTDWWTFSGGIGSINKSSVVINQIKAYGYGAGIAPAVSLAVHDFSSPLAGSSSDAPMPVQCCMVMSKLTGAPGRKNRGRMYLPVTATALDTNMQFSTTKLGNVVDSTASLYSDIAAVNLAGADTTPIVASQQTTAPVIISIKGDSEPDIQRRRADKLVATSTHSASV